MSIEDASQASFVFKSLQSVDLHFYLPFPSNFWISLSVVWYLGNWLENFAGFFCQRHLCSVKVDGWSRGEIYLFSGSITKVDKRWWGWERWLAYLMFIFPYQLESIQPGLTSVECLLCGLGQVAWPLELCRKMESIPHKIVVRIKWQIISENIWQFLAVYQVLNKY